MDRFTQQFFGSRSKSAFNRSDSAPKEAREKDGRGFVESVARSLAKSAAKRAMHEMSGNRSRAGGGGHADRAFNTEDFEKLGGFVLEMVGTVKEGNDRRREKKRRQKDRERRRGRDRDRRGRDDGERDRGRDLQFDDDYGEQPTYESKRSRKRRRHGDSGSPLHVTFAEPLEGFDYAPPRTHRRRRHHRHDDREDREDRAEPYENPSGPDRQPPGAGVAYSPGSPYESPSDRRRSERRSHRRRPKIDLQSLRTELEHMSSTIVSLNARSTNHRDCEFYDKFVRKGGRLQERIGDTLGQIRGLEEGGDGYATWHEEEMRARKKRRRERDW